MAGLATSLLELGLEGEMLDILVKTFKVTLSNMVITYSCHTRVGFISVQNTYIAP
jgi:hypothetical protein